MDIATTAGVVGTVVTLVATYHVAARQGAFRRARYAAGVGPPDAGRKAVEWPFAIVVLLPPLPADRYLFTIPVSLSHVSGPGLADVRCQVLMPRENSLEKIAAADIHQLERMDDLKDQRDQAVSGEAWMTNFKLSHLRPDEHIVMAALASEKCWSKSLPLNDPTEADAEGSISEFPLTLGVFTPQHKGEAKHTRVLLVRTKNDKLSPGAIATIVSKSVQRDREKVLIARVWVSRLLKIPIGQYRCLVVTPSFYKFSATTAIEGTLCGEEMSRYDWLTVALFPDRVNPRRLSRRDA